LSYRKRVYTEYFTFLSTDDSSENLISPCDCTGTLGLVHKSCLEKWLSASNKTECEICKYQFNTSRHPRSVWQWFRSHQGSNCCQGLYGDLSCFLILTPPCLVSIYLCGMGSAMYVRHGLWEAMGLAILCCFLFATFLLWVAITVRLVILCHTP
jgi:Protein involved in mRNA turnover and stability